MTIFTDSFRFQKLFNPCYVGYDYKENSIQGRKVNLYRALCFVFFLSLNGTTLGQIYESTDSEGVPTFSDQPSADSHEIELQEINVGDPLVKPESTSAPPSPTEETSTPEVNVEVQEDDDDSDSLREELREERNEERREDNIDDPGDVETQPAKILPGQHDSRSGQSR